MTQVYNSRRVFGIHWNLPGCQLAFKEAGVGKLTPLAKSGSLNAALGREYQIIDHH